MTERKNQRKYLTYNASQKAGEWYNLAPSMPMRKLNFLHLLWSVFSLEI